LLQEILQRAGIVPGWRQFEFAMALELEEGDVSLRLFSMITTF